MRVAAGEVVGGVGGGGLDVPFYCLSNLREGFEPTN